MICMVHGLLIMHTSVVLEGNTIKAIEDNFNRKFKVSINKS